MALPLQGLRVIDLTQDFAGPFCTMILSDLGAEVIKIEKPGTGDETRAWGPPFVNGISYYFLSLNLGKKSVVLDLKTREGQRIIRKLVVDADISAGHYASTAILAALSRRLVTGAGDYIDLSLHDSIVSWLTYQASYYFATDKEPQRLGSAHPSIVPYQAFRCKDEDLVLAIGNDHQWENFCRAAGLERFFSDGRFSTNPSRVKNGHLLIPVLQRMFRRRDAKEWQTILDKAKVPVAPVFGIRDVMHDPHVRNRKMIVGSKRNASHLGSPMRFYRTSQKETTSAPQLGQHTREILDSLRT